MFKKYLACFLIICFSLPAVSLAKEGNFSQEAFEKAANALCSLELTENILTDDYKPFEPVTKAEFAELCSRLITGNNADMYQNGFMDSGFLDVPDDYWAQNYITMLKQLNIITGEDGGVFLPDENITLEQAAAMLVKLLGYKNYAELNGGYSSGYLMEATKLKLLSGISASAGDEINRAQMAILGYRALSVELFNANLFYNGNIGPVTTNKTLLSATFNLEKHTGVVLASKEQALVSGSNLESGQMLIDGIMFDSDIDDIYKYVGKRVSVYYDGESGIPFVKALFEEENTEYVLNRNEIYGLTTSDVKITANNNRGERELKFSENAIWSINNQPCLKYFQNEDAEISFFNKSDITSEEKKKLYSYVGASELETPDINGYIVLSDTNDDNVIDIIRMYYFQSFVVREAKADEYTLVLKNSDGTLRAVDIEDIDTYVYRKNILADFADISEDETVSLCYAQNINGEPVISIFADSTNKSGEVNKLNSDGRVVIDGINYYTTKGVRSQIVIGKNMEYYTDCCGYIFAIDKNSKQGMREGYLVRAAETNGMDKYLQVMIYDKHGLNKYTSAEKIRYSDGSLNGFSQKTANEVLNILQGKSQLIRYEINDDGLLSEIQTAYEKTSRSEMADFIKDYELKNYSHNSKYRINNKYLMDANTKVYFIPGSYESTAELYSTGGYLDLVLYSIFDKIEVYSADGYVAESLVVTYNQESAQPVVRYANACIITDVQEVFSDNGSEIMVELLEKGVRKTIYALTGTKSINDCDNNFGYGDTPVEQLKKGDVVQVVYIGDRLAGFRILSRISELSGQYYNVTNSNTNPSVDTFDHIYIGYGKIKDVYPKALVFNANPSQAEEFDRIMLAENTMYVYKVQKRNCEVEQITFSNVRPDDEVVVRITSNKVLEMFVIGN